MQGLAHWMSVMAEHMNHESSLHPAYMWHNGIDQKMSLTEQQQLLQKGGRLLGKMKILVLALLLVCVCVSIGISSGIGQFDAVFSIDQFWL